jgi:hypothetical protein
MGQLRFFGGFRRGGTAHLLWRCIMMTRNVFVPAPMPASFNYNCAFVSGGGTAINSIH